MISFLTIKLTAWSRDFAEQLRDLLLIVITTGNRWCWSRI